MLDRVSVEDIIRRALIEDLGGIDNTNEYLIDPEDKSTAIVKFKESGIVAGLKVFKWVFEILDPHIEVSLKVKDGDKLKTGEEIAVLNGSTLSILKGERVALNFLQRMSGIACISNEYARKVEDLDVKIVDTRKTTPGLRLLEKYAVKVGGCYNHRYSLADAIMIKDNHIKAIGDIKSAVKRARSQAPHTIKIEVETENLEQVEQAIESGADIIMLDNMSIEDMKVAVDLIDKRAIVEASGNVNIENVLDIARSGVDIISVGALTHSIISSDISLNIL